MAWQAKVVKERKIKERLSRAKFLLGFIIFSLLLAFFKKSGPNIKLPKITLDFSPREEIIIPVPSPSIGERLFRELQLADLKPQKIKEENNQAEIILEEAILAVFTLEKPVSSQVASLQMILNRFKIEGKKPKKVDLRFEKPIVTF